MLNGLWLGFFLVAAVSALAQWLIGGNAGIFAAMVESIFAMAKLSVEVMVLLFGTLTLWLGFLKIAEKAGIVEWLAKVLGPLFARLMPEVPPGHPALGLITMNFAANGLGLDNAATPIGLKAMRALQELNPSSTTASNAQILFLVLNASSLTLLPVTIFMYRAQQGAPDPTMVFLPILLATSVSTLVGLLSVAVMQRLRLWDPVVLAYFIPGALLLGGFMAFLGTLSAAALASLSSILGNLTLFGVILLFVVIGALRQVKVYEAFVEGAKEGFDVAKNLLPYLVAMLVAVGVLRASGAGIGVGRYSPCGQLAGPGHALRRRPADSVGQAVLRERGAGNADRDHAEPRGGQLPCPGGGNHPGQYRDDFLCAGGVFRRGGHPACAACGGVCAAGRVLWCSGSHLRVLLVLCLNDLQACTASTGKH